MMMKRRLSGFFGLFCFVLVWFGLLVCLFVCVVYFLSCAFGVNYVLLKEIEWHRVDKILQYPDLSISMASQPPPLTYHPRNKGLIRPYKGKPMVNKP